VSDTLPHGGAGGDKTVGVGLKWRDLRNTICICTSKRRSCPARTPPHAAAAAAAAGCGWGIARVGSESFRVGSATRPAERGAGRRRLYLRGRSTVERDRWARELGELPPPPPSRTNWTRLVPPSVLTGHVSPRYPGERARAAGERELLVHRLSPVEAARARARELYDSPLFGVGVGLVLSTNFVITVRA